MNKKSSFLDSDSDSDEEPGNTRTLGGDADSDMDLDDPEPRSVSMATGITHDHPYAWALDGRVAGVNEGSGLPGHIHVSVNTVLQCRKLGLSLHAVISVFTCKPFWVTLI